MTSGQEKKKFNLVSLEEQATPKTAVSAYSSYDPSVENAGMDFNESTPPSKAIVTQSAKEDVEETYEYEEEYEETYEYEEEVVEEKPVEKKAKPEKTKPDKKKPEKVSEEKIEQTVDDILERLQEFKQSITTLVTNASQTSKNIALAVSAPLLPIANKVLKILNGPIQLINRISQKLNERMGRSQPVQVQSNGEGRPEETEKELTPKAPLPKIGFSDMIELNIIFTDNMKRSLYNPNQSRVGGLGAMEEQLIMDTAKSAIKECAEFTSELPTPNSGRYQGIAIFDIMSNITDDDIKTFLRFVKAYPGKYIGKEWKVSETFATWLINNAPMPGN